MKKVITEVEIKGLRGTADALGERIVMTNGCFDILHVGHVRFLCEAKALVGDKGKLFVGVNSDASVKKLKGEGRPINSSSHRMEVLSALECVDYVCEFGELRATGLICNLRPHIYVKGGDYDESSLNEEERKALEEVSAEVKILKLTKGKSTTNTINAIREK